MTERLVDHFEALHAERERSWEPEKLRRNVEQRRALVAAFDPATTVKAGDRIAPFTLESADGASIDSVELTAGGPVALIFFRFAGCPACNIALPYYDRALRPALDAAGVRLVAVSPHLSENGLGEIAVRHGLCFPVAADRGNALARRLGLTFIPDNNPPVAPGDTGWIGALTGTGTWELPKPAIVIIDRHHVVRFADVSPDWLRRTEAEAVIDTLAGLRLANRRVIADGCRAEPAARLRDAITGMLDAKPDGAIVRPWNRDFAACFQPAGQADRQRVYGVVQRPDTHPQPG